MRISARQVISSLYDYKRFEKSFTRRLEIVNAKNYIQFIVGEDLRFVHDEWLRSLGSRRVMAHENPILVIAQDIIGELAHLIARHDSVFSGRWPPPGDLDPETASTIEFIYRNRNAYFALDYGSVLYRTMMHFETQSYPPVDLFKLRRFVEDVTASPTRARVFLRRLGYPGYKDTLLERD